MNGIGAPALGVGPGDGILLYRQIVDFNNESKAVVVFDSQTVSYFSIAGDSWVGFEDMFSIRRKVQYAKSSGLGGYFFWALGQDKDWILSMHGGYNRRHSSPNLYLALFWARWPRFFLVFLV